MSSFCGRMYDGHQPIDDHGTMYSVCAICHEPISCANASGLGPSTRTRTKRGIRITHRVWRVSRTARTLMMIEPGLRLRIGKPS